MIATLNVGKDLRGHVITTEDQLKNQANFLGSTGKLFLVRCMNCPDSGERGRENYGIMVATGRCAWCGWEDTRTDYLGDNECQ